MAKLVFNVAGRIHRAADLGYDQFSETPPQPVNGNAHCAFTYAERPGGFGLGHIRTFARQPRFQHVKLRVCSRSVRLLFRGSQSAMQNAQRPFPIARSLDSLGLYNRAASEKLPSLAGRQARTGRSGESRMQ
jgi:hypothetical protein